MNKIELVDYSSEVEITETLVKLISSRISESDDTLYLISIDMSNFHPDILQNLSKEISKRTKSKFLIVPEGIKVSEVKITHVRDY